MFGHEIAFANRQTVRRHENVAANLGVGPHALQGGGLLLP